MIIMSNRKGNISIKNYWSVTEGVFSCLIDKKRSQFFRKAIKNTVRNGDVVVDAGSGSGILSMFAVDAGAKKVYAIELDDNNLKTLKDIFEINGYGNKIVVMRGDATNIKIPEKVDVIIAEMIATGLIDELQLPVMNNLLRFSKKNTRILIDSYESFIELVYNKDNYYGFGFRLVRYEFADVKNTKSKIFSNKNSIGKIYLFKTNKEAYIKKNILMKIKKPGLINGIRLSGQTTFFDKSVFNYSYSYNFPIILPIKEIKVSRRDVFRVSLSYKMCGGMDSLKYNIKKE